ncbi:MAG: HAD-IA family hydrolase [Acidimicrobiales bacterium]
MENGVTAKENLSNAWLVLDVDGVLLDSRRAGRGTWKDEFSARFNVNADELRAAFFEKYWNDVVIGLRDVTSTLSAALSQLQWDIDVEDALACWFEADFSTNDDVLEKVATLSKRGVLVAVATNQEHRRAAFLHERLQNLVPLRGFVYSAQLGLLKSDHRFFVATQHRLGLRAERGRVVLVDDSLENVVSARRAQWHAVHFEESRDWYAQVESVLCAD